MYPFEVKIAPAKLVVRKLTASSGQAEGRQALRPAPAGSEIGHGSRRQGRSRLVRRASRQRRASREVGHVRREPGRLRLGDPGECEGQDLPGLRYDRVRRPQGRKELLGENQLAPFVRRFALLSLAVVVASTGTASGGLRPIGERFRELTVAGRQQCATEYEGDVAVRAANPGDRHVEPAAARRSRAAKRLFEGGHSAQAERREQLLRGVSGAARDCASAGDLRSPSSDPAGEGLASISGASRRVRGQPSLCAATEAPGFGDRRERLPESSVHDVDGQRAVGHRRDAVLDAHRRDRRGGQGRGGRRRRRFRASLPRPDGLLVPARVPEGTRRADDAQGDRRAGLRGLRRQRRRARPRAVVPRNLRRGSHRRKGEHGRQGRCPRRLPGVLWRLSSGRLRPERRRPPRVHR